MTLLLRVARFIGGVATVLWFIAIGAALILMMAQPARAHALDRAECRSYARTGLNIAELRSEGLAKLPLAQRMREELEVARSGSWIQDREDSQRLADLLDSVYADGLLPGAAYDRAQQACVKDLPPPPARDQNELPDGIAPSGPQIKG